MQHMEKPEILLDVPYEDLLEILKDDKWNADTVTKKLGASPEERSDDNIKRYAEGTECVIVTDDKDFVSRLKALGILALRIEKEDRGRIIKEKLHKQLG